MQTNINMIEQNNDHTQIMYKMQFRISFKNYSLHKKSHLEVLL